ncbi:MULTISPECIES: site-specific recombinase [unclassified Rubrivivax]|uniref:site-specific recombinase n=1 Tax=unclassified Rubrivivax TaxID=2649762 RepID=UPI001E5FA75C|nr:MULTISPECIES: site-specific recombinase [unclassified Rubrivivax]MCC9596978.1 site-specific recombinase [Rubrivivax sp. JA1055]MCC9649133.1 site-specific recombinase [Rubrivivax sp. JA1029]
MTQPTWDLSALVNAADPSAGLAERHLWLVRLLEWLRHAPAARRARPGADVAPQMARLGLLLKAAEGQPEFRARLQGMLAGFWREVDKAALFAEFGFGARHSLFGEVGRRLRVQWLPQTPDTPDLAELFQLLFRPSDARWIERLDDATLERIATLVDPDGASGWRTAMLDAITILVSAVHSSGYLSPLRRRMDRQALATEPFRQLTRSADALREALAEGRQADALREANVLRGLLDACRRAAASVTGHLEEYGVSVDIVYELDQMRRRTRRIGMLLDCVLAPQPMPALRALVLHLLRVADDERGLRRLLARHYSLLARQVAERSAETGSHYITRDRGEWREMLRMAAGGGAVIAGTTYLKFAIAALGLAAFWSGFWSGVNYAASFVVIMLLHWTVATKQPAMTAPAMAETLAAGTGDAEVEAFVDRVAQLIRSQAAGIIGNLAVCGPLALAIQLAWEGLFGVPLVGEQQAGYVLHSLTLLGPTLLFAAFTGVLLFASSLIAGWAENWFVYHRLDSAIAWNPRFVARLGAPRAQRWAAWWRANISGLVANVSLGMMLGLVPALASFFALPLEVRHVTLSTGQLAAAAGALGLDVLRQPAFWWCVAGILLTGVLNLTVSFWLAFKVALRSRGIQVRERQRITAAIRRRLLQDPLSFVRPPKG